MSAHLNASLLALSSPDLSTWQTAVTGILIGLFACTWPIFAVQTIRAENTRPADRQESGLVIALGVGSFLAVLAWATYLLLA